MDDILILAEKETHIDQVITMLKTRFKEVKSEKGKDLSYLGMRLQQQGNTISVEMEAFIQEVLDEYKEKIANRSSPAKTDLFAINESSPPLQIQGKKRFHQMVAKLLYLAKQARPDILLAISFLCTRVQKPSKQDESKLERVLGYLTNSRGLAL